MQPEAQTVEPRGNLITISDIMTAKPVTTHRNATLYEALKLMESVPCHHLPVMGREGHLIGVVSARDCTSALECWDQQEHQPGETADQIRVRNVMTPAPIIIESNSAATEAARLMLNHDIRCLPVMRDETLIGILTTSDLLIAFMQMCRS